jgi:hypothetical protein
MEIIHMTIQTEETQDTEKITVKKVLTWVGYVLAAPIALFIVIPIILFYEAALVYAVVAEAWKKIRRHGHD